MSKNTEYSDYLNALELIFQSVLDRVGLNTDISQEYALTLFWSNYVQRYCAEHIRYSALVHVDLMEKFIACYYTPPANKEATLRKVFAKLGKTYVQDALGAYLYWRKARPDSYKPNRWNAMKDFVTATESIW